jgi:cytochrome c oxidase assembly protein subunit 15
MHPMQSPRYIPSLHVVALLTATATFPLIFMGGLVTSHQAGLSVPDWPNSYGYNMFLFPPHLWIGGILYEHTHRLMGTVVGMLSIVLAVWTSRVETRRWVRWLAASTLLAVILQGVLGGLRVVLVELDLAIVHACVAQAFFCLAGLVAVVTSRRWIESQNPPVTRNAVHGRRLITACFIVLFAIYAQLVVGAVMRHYDAGLAVPDLPLAYGKLIPPTDPASMDLYNRYRAWNLNLPPVTATQIWLHMGHCLGAVLVTLLVLWASNLVFLHHRSQRALVIPASTLIALIVLQITLGILTVYKRKPADVASAHVAVGALILATMFILSVRVVRLCARSQAAH